MESLNDEPRPSRAGVLKSFRSSIRGVDSARQMAWGVTLGMMIGIVPKESAWWGLLAVVLVLFNANLITGLISAIAFSWGGPLLEPWAHELGSRVLGHPLTESWLAAALALPGIPWLRLENTVVLGSVLMGLLAALPMYRLSHVILSRYRRILVATLRRSFLSRWLLGDQLEQTQTTAVIDG